MPLIERGAIPENCDINPVWNQGLYLNAAASNGKLPEKTVPFASKKATVYNSIFKHIQFYPTTHLPFFHTSLRLTQQQQVARPAEMPTKKIEKRTPQLKRVNSEEKFTNMDVSLFSQQGQSFEILTFFHGTLQSQASGCEYFLSKNIEYELELYMVLGIVSRKLIDYQGKLPTQFYS